MNSRIGWFVAWVLFGLLPVAWSQKGPQDNFVFEDDRAWGSEGSGNGQFAFTGSTDQKLPMGMVFDGTNVFVGDWGNNRIQVFDREGSYIRQWGGSGSATGKFSRLSGLAADDANIFVSDRGNQRVQVFSKSGAFVRSWGVKGSGNGQFSEPMGIAVDDQRVYVADSYNNRIQVFDKDGVFQAAWGTAGSVAGQFNLPVCVAVDLQYVYVIDAWNHRLQVFDKSGNYVRSWDLPILTPGNGLWISTFCVAVDEHCVFVGIGQDAYTSVKTYFYVYNKYGGLLSQPSHTLSSPAAIALGNPMSYLYDPGTTRVVPFRRYFRTLGSLVPDPIPLVDVLSVNQRSGIPVLDVDYLVTDANDATVTVRAVAFVGGTNTALSVTNLIPMRTFIEGTDTNIGPGIATGPSRRLTWDMEADGVSAKIPEWGSLRPAILAKDTRGLLDLHFLNIPSVGTNSAFTISRDPLTQSDLLPVWFWLAASGDAAVALTNGQLVGVGGAYNGQVLASGTNTTSAGCAFLFERIGVRLATATELQVAREGGTPGSVIQRTPRRQPPPAGYKVNAFNFVTYPTNGWWVVPLNP